VVRKSCGSPHRCGEDRAHALLHLDREDDDILVAGYGRLLRLQDLAVYQKTTKHAALSANKKTKFPQ
jgi:hypothetical protein